MNARTSLIALLFGLLAGCTQPIVAPSGGGSVGPTSGSAGSGGSFIGGSGFPTGGFGQFNEPVIRADSPPPPVSGGTLAVVAQGHLAAVSDPDRDQIVVVDLDTVRVSSRFALEKGDEPGRIVEDGAGHVHVALRGAGAVITLDAKTGTLLERRSICVHPRGLAYDKTLDLVHVACAGGQLISLPATGGAPVRQVMLDRDLRDVVVDGQRLLVSRFRAAEMLIVEADGHVSARMRPPSVSLDPQSFDPSGSPTAGTDFEPAVAWRMTANPGGGALLAFQEEQTTEVQTSTGGYGGGCGGIVRASVALLSAEGASWTVVSLPVVLPVDLALAPNGMVDVISASTPGAPANIFGNSSLVSFGVPSSAKPMDTGRCRGGGSVPVIESDNSAPFQFEGQPVAIAYDRQGRRIVQTREPYMLIVGPEAVTLPGESRRDTGHDIFHLGTGGGIACASCHPEGREDGHVWKFAGDVGERRTQSVGGGILGTEPFHWAGDMTDFSLLAHDVFTTRMSGPGLESRHVDVLAHYVDQIPPFKPEQVLDPASVDRGRALFQNAAIGCVSCHSGTKMTNNTNVNVGTGQPFQVPSLIGVGWRAPYLHSGCAPTLEARFGECGGGELHGHTSGLSASDRGDLVSYLQSL